VENRQILIDSNILIEYLRAKDKENTILFKFQECDFYISVISIFELLAGANTTEKKQQAKTLVENFIKVDFTEKDAELAGDMAIFLRNEGINFKNFNDIFIASTALTNDLPILTFNTKDFQHIQNLKLIKI
jgi:tRNA(fMet)-specific endonuclease VapC